MIPVRIDIDFGDGKQRLAEIALANTDFTPLMLEVSEFLLDRVEENFEQEGRPAWTPLKASTIKEREKTGHWPGKILQRSGSLAASFSAEHDATSATVGTNKEYATTQQFGAKKGAFGQTARGAPIPWSDIPARDMFSIDDQDRAALLEIILDYERRTAAGG